MNKSIYIILALVGILAMDSCSDDEFLSGNPDMELGAGKVSALYGDSLPFTIKASVLKCITGIITTLTK